MDGTWFEIARLVVPLVAGVIAGAGLAWKVYTWRHERRAHVSVSASAGLLVFDGPHDDPHVFVEAVNGDPRPVTITSVWLEHPDEPEGLRAFLVPTPPGATLPGPIEGRHRGTTWSSIPALENGGFRITDREVVAAVKTAAEEVFRSKPKVLFGS